MASFLTAINDALENAIANSTAFQTWTGTASAAAAKGFIYNFDQTDDPESKYCNIRDIEPWSFTRDGEGSDAGGALFMTDAQIEVYFYTDVEDWTEAAARAFLDAIGAVIAHIRDNGATYAVRFSQIVKKPYDDVFRLRTIDGATKGYQYACIVTHRV